jgi:hypothetical protein
LGDPRDIEQIIEEQSHLPNLSLDHILYPLKLLRRKLGRGKDLSSGADRCERVAEFMRERCKEDILALISLTQRRTGGPQRFELIT